MENAVLFPLRPDEPVVEDLKAAVREAMRAGREILEVNHAVIHGAHRRSSTNVSDGSPHYVIESRIFGLKQPRVPLSGVGADWHLVAELPTRKLVCEGIKFLATYPLGFVKADPYTSGRIMLARHGLRMASHDEGPSAN